ncbi:MAG: metallophosphoesterase [Gemmatimonadaceae bacterium]|nr:metallophosphoesterase [Gemmatimonadaceae bacterium]MCW5826759.1 metallophosphoesterase [Gemmatimonadaceae bacterium]
MRLLQVSDVHFGRHAVEAYTDAVQRRVAGRRYDAVVVAGDLTQRNFRGQFRAAKQWLDAMRAEVPVLTVPGNHDVAWWWKPVGVGVEAPLLAGYRKWIDPELEPTLHLPGVTIVGLNSCHGVRTYTLTARARDLSVVGAIRPAQWAKAKAAFDAAPAGDLKVLVFHHNLLRGDLSRRWGLVNKADGIGEALETGADLVLNGHDHQTRIEAIELMGRKMVVSHSTSFCERTRGGLPAAFQEIEVEPKRLVVRACVWSDEMREFTPRNDRVFPR